MNILLLSAGDWANIISAFASLFASVVALVIAFKKPKRITFEFLTGGIFNHDEYYKRWSIENIIHTMSENVVTVNALRINAINLDINKKVIAESGIIIKWSFKRIKLGNYLTMTLQQNISEPIDFGHDSNGFGHILSLNSYKLNPFISNRKVSFRVYVKDTSGKIYKSEIFKKDNFK